MAWDQKRHDELWAKYSNDDITDAELYELRQLKREFINDHFVISHVGGKK